MLFRSPFKVTLVWSDYASTETAAQNLVNNLNLVVTAPDGVTVYRGNVFNGGWSQTGGSADGVNNVENVYVQSAAVGNWTVEVSAANTPNGPQPFALVVDGSFGAVDNPPTVTITNPADGATVSGTINITADASDDNGVTQVEFFVDGNSIGTDANGADGWTMPWDTTTVGDGGHTVTATATDTIGQAGSDSNNVTVDNVPDPTLHVGDLDGSSADASRGRWDATVTITVHEAGENPVANATVSGAWSAGATGSSSCTTNGSGQCSVTKGSIKGSVSSVVFTVDSVTHSTLAYSPGSNHDPDGDSNGTTITVNKPASNTPPTATISQPADGVSFASGALISFAGAASDAEDGDVTASLIWTSNIDGQIGVGGSFNTVLSDGNHTITATATDSAGASGSDTVSITVGNPPPPVTIHVGDLDGSASAAQGGKWNATVAITVHDASENPVANATVSGTWSAGASGSDTCVTSGSGQCSITKNNINKNSASVTFTVGNVTATGFTYDSGANHEPDGDSNGSSITILKP